VARSDIVGQITVYYTAIKHLFSSSKACCERGRRKRRAHGLNEAKRAKEGSNLNMKKTSCISEEGGDPHRRIRDWDQDRKKEHQSRNPLKQKLFNAREGATRRSIKKGIKEQKNPDSPAH